MIKTRIIMGMPILVEISDVSADEEIFEKIFSYFTYVDEKFSTYKDASEISGINKGLILSGDYSEDMRKVLHLSEYTRLETDGYFDIKRPDGRLDPSGLVKGWSIWEASKILDASGIENYYIEAGGDIQAKGNNSKGESWKIGILNPFNPKEIVKAIALSGGGVATSGDYIRGRHIYNPKTGQEADGEIVSLTVIGPNIYEADRFATASFAMGRKGIEFIEGLNGLEGYMIDRNGMATMTTGFNKYVHTNA